MKKSVSIVILIITSALIASCSTTSKSTKTIKSNPENSSFVTITADDPGSFSDTVRTTIEKIRHEDKKTKFNQSIVIGKKTVPIKPGKNKLQVKCMYRGFYNHQVIETEISENEDYVVYCLADISDILLGKRANAFYALVAKKSDFEETKKYNQKIIDAPPTDQLTSTIEQGKTRVVLFNKRSKVLTWDNSYPYSLYINNTSVTTYYPGRYIVLDIENGEYNFKFEYRDLFIFKKEQKIELDGKTIYIESSNGAASMNINILNESPENFTLNFKPNDLSRYFK